MTRSVSQVHFRERAMLRTCSLPGTGLRDWGETLTENCKQDLGAVAGGAEGDTSWPELTGRRVEATSSGRMLFLWRFLSALRFCSSSIQLRICSPITEDFICHVFVYSLLAYARRTLTYSKPGGLFVYTYVCSLRTRDDAQGPGGRWFACQSWIISGDHGRPWHVSVRWSDTEESWGALTNGVKRCLLFLVSKGLGVRRQGSNPSSATVWRWPTSFTTKGLHFLIYITKIL